MPPCWHVFRETRGIKSHRRSYPNRWKYDLNILLLLPQTSQRSRKTELDRERLQTNQHTPSFAQTTKRESFDSNPCPPCPFIISSTLHRENIAIDCKIECREENVPHIRYMTASHVSHWKEYGQDTDQVDDGHCTVLFLNMAHND